MNTVEFVKQLRATSNELMPLAESVSAAAVTWNGVEYVKAREKQPEPYALAWQSILNALADMIEGQESPLSDKQVAYLDRLLFGGMGSLSDLSFDPKSNGEIATTVNGRLDKQRRALYASFKNG